MANWLVKQQINRSSYKSQNITDSTNLLDNMKNFNEMHDNAILDIFKFLDVKNLKTATEVCKKWNKVISENSHSLRELRKLKFVFTMDWKEKTAEMDRKTFLRLVSTVVFSGCLFDQDDEVLLKVDSEILEILSTLHKQIRVVHLDELEIEVETFKMLLSMFQLDKLSIKRLKFTETTGTDVTLATGQAAISSDHHEKVLRLLDLANPSQTTLKILAEMKYQTTKLALNIDDEDEDYNVSTSAFAQFMKQQKFLKQFVVEKLHWDDDGLNFIIEQLKSSKLEQLGLIYFRATDKCITELIKSQPTLKELEVESPQISADTIKAIYEADNLQVLKLNLHYEGPSNLELPNPCRPHANLKKIVIDKLNATSTLESFDVMMRMFANIEELQINSVSVFGYDMAANKILLSAQKHLKSLKFIDVPSTLQNFLPESIPSLEKYHTDRALSWQQLQSLLSKNRSLKVLRVYKIESTEGSKLEITAEMLRELHESFPNLMKIEIFDMQNIVIAETVAARSPIEVVETIKTVKDLFYAIMPHSLI